MPSYLAAVLRNDSLNAPAHSLHPQLGARSVAAWPVNEIVLQSLVLAGKNSAEIASKYGVSVDQVSGLRQAFDL